MQVLLVRNQSQSHLALEPLHFVLFLQHLEHFRAEEFFLEVDPLLVALVRLFFLNLVSVFRVRLEV